MKLLSRAASRVSAAFMVAVIGLFVFGKIAYELRETDTNTFDRSVLLFFQQHQTPALRTIMGLLSQVAGTYVIPAIIGATVLYFWRQKRFWPDGATMLLAGAGGWGLMELLKHLFHRPRYDTLYDKLGYSFPSGHAFFALTIYGMLTYWLTRGATPMRKVVLWTVFALVTLLVGGSRIVLAAHYPTDVLAGYAIAAPWLWGCLALSAAFVRRGRLPAKPVDNPPNP